MCIIGFLFIFFPVLHKFLINNILTAWHHSSTKGNYPNTVSNINSKIQMYNIITCWVIKDRRGEILNGKSSSFGNNGMYDMC